jgi:hypothetical protein
MFITSKFKILILLLTTFNSIWLSQDFFFFTTLVGFTMYCNKKKGVTVPWRQCNTKGMAEAAHETYASR